MIPLDIDDRIARARAAYAACNLCERRCGTNRLGERPAADTYCGLGAGGRMFNELLHFGEELDLIPSHAVYLTGCNFRCVFCMTGDFIVPEGLEKGVRMEPEAFGRLHARRRAEGATNVNFLGGEPSVNLLAILEGLRRCPSDTKVVWNSNMYFTEEQAVLLRGVVDVYLADWKYGNDACALKLSAAPRYLDVVRRNLRFAVETARAIVRYLVMPGHNDCCFRPIARMMRDEFPGVELSILDPYVPLFRAPRVPGMDRPSTRADGDEVRAIALEHGLRLAE
jgi:putative pyruvate formate lyase activating enzyme